MAAAAGINFLVMGVVSMVLNTIVMSKWQSKIAAAAGIIFVVMLILSTDFADAIKWKPGDENVRKFPINRTLQNDRIFSTDKTIHNARIQNIGKMQNDRRFLDQPLQNFRRLPNDRTLQNVRGLPKDRTLRNVRGPPNDRTLQNVRGLPNDRTLQNVRGLPNDRTLQNVRGLPNDRTLENVRGFPNDKTLQNVRGFPNNKTLPNSRRISFLKSIQNATTLQIDDKMKNERNFSVDIRFPNDRRMEYNKRLHSPRINLSDTIMPNEKRINVNRLLEHNRRSQNELKKKIESLMQNENIQLYEMQQDGRNIQGARKNQNDRQSPAKLKEQNRRILDPHNHKLLNSRSDKRTGFATPHPQLLRQLGPPLDERSEGFNSMEFKIHSERPVEVGGGWGLVWSNLVDVLDGLRIYTPPGGTSLTVRACYSIAQTYITATGDFKKYYMMRGFYENNIQFEVGYLVAEIVSKYQRMLELFHMATEYFFQHEGKRYAVGTYVFYLYTNVLEMGTVIAHLCNMLTELEDKYTFNSVRQSGFSDYHLIKVMDDKDKVSMAQSILAYEKKMKRLKREKERELKKMRDKTLYIGMTVTSPNRRPKYRSWPLIYGWSIEGPW